MEVRAPSGRAGRPAPGRRRRRLAGRPKGLYENQDESQPEMNLRGRFRTDAEGRYWFRTVARPATRCRPTAPGRPAAGAAPPLHRPAHLHFMVSAPGAGCSSRRSSRPAASTSTATWCSASPRRWWPRRPLPPAADGAPPVARLEREFELCPRDGAPAAADPLSPRPPIPSRDPSPHRPDGRSQGPARGPVAVIAGGIGAIGFAWPAAGAHGARVVLLHSGATPTAPKAGRAAARRGPLGARRGVRTARRARRRRRAGRALRRAHLLVNSAGNTNAIAPADLEALDDATSTTCCRPTRGVRRRSARSRRCSKHAASR